MVWVRLHLALSRAEWGTVAPAAHFKGLFAANNAQTSACGQSGCVRTLDCNGLLTAVSLEVCRKRHFRKGLATISCCHILYFFKKSDCHETLIPQLFLFFKCSVYNFKD
jgi:hypothetical protein